MHQEKAGKDSFFFLSFIKMPYEDYKYSKNDSTKQPYKEWLREDVSHEAS